MALDYGARAASFGQPNARMATKTATAIRKMSGQARSLSHRFLEALEIIGTLRMLNPPRSKASVLAAVTHLRCCADQRLLVNTAGSRSWGSPQSVLRTIQSGVVTHMTRDPKIIGVGGDGREYDPLLTPEQVAKRLNTSLDWVWDHSSRKAPLLPVIRFGEGPGRAGMLRYRASRIEEFIVEQERQTQTRRTTFACKMRQPTCSPTEE
jgi:hypothetical protein